MDNTFAVEIAETLSDLKELQDGETELKGGKVRTVGAKESLVDRSRAAVKV